MRYVWVGNQVKEARGCCPWSEIFKQIFLFTSILYQGQVITMIFMGGLIPFHMLECTQIQ